MSINRKRQLCRLTIVGLILLLTITIGGCRDSNHPTVNIALVENNLLPSVLIEGEIPYTLAERMEHYKVPGLSIAVIKDFEIEWVKHYGVRNAKLGQPVTDSSLFCVGSLSKAVAAATVLRLAELGKIDLDANVNDYLTSWKLPENEFTKKSPVTARRLLNHSGGVIFTPPEMFTPDKVPTLIQILDSEPPLNMRPTRVDVEPGTKFQYSNGGYSILQVLVEDITGESYVDFARKAVFDPLGMKHSTFEQPLPADKQSYASARHKSNGDVYEIQSVVYPRLTAGGLFTTAEEYAKFVIEIQKSLHNESNLIMSQDLAQQMISPQEAKEYGLGVFMRYLDDVTYFGHIGDSRGFIGGFNSHPTDGYGAVVVINCDGSIPIAREILNSVAKVYGWQSYLRETHTTVELSPELMDKYAGRYRIGFDKVCTIYKQDDDLYYHVAGVPDFKLWAITEDTMKTKDWLGQIVFIRDSEGEVVNAIPHFADDVGRLPAVETKATKMQEGEKTPLEMLLEGEVEKALIEYRKHKKANPDDAYVSENRFNRLGYQLMGQDKLKEALAVFGLNTELYPESGNCYDSMGEALLKSGDKQGALKNYEKALELNPANGNAAQYVEKIKAELNL